MVLIIDDSLEWSIITDGYWHRFFVVAPEPAIYSAREIRLYAIPSVSIQIYLNCLRHQDKLISIVEEDIPTIEEIFDHFNQLAHDLGPYDFFLW